MPCVIAEGYRYRSPSTRHRHSGTGNSSTYLDIGTGSPSDGCAVADNRRHSDTHHSDKMASVDIEIHLLAINEINDKILYIV